MRDYLSRSDYAGNGLEEDLTEDKVEQGCEDNLATKYSMVTLKQTTTVIHNKTFFRTINIFSSYFMYVHCLQRPEQ